MSKAVEGLKPALLWEHFYQISQIPRCSKSEEAVRSYVLKVAERNGLRYQMDDAKSVVVRKPATPGKDRQPIVVLQSHLDMVCEKNKETRHNFETDPIRLLRKKDWITADGTTLGSDNGIGVAAALAVMEDKTLAHGPLELLFTVDEETGLTGAINLGEDMLEGRILINMDSEEDGCIYIGCAGGRDTEFFLPIEKEDVPAGYVPFRLRVGGLQGGHSGLQIDQGLGNAVKLCARLLNRLSAGIDFRLGMMDGGSKHNAIPRECDAIVFIKPEQIAALKSTIEETQKIFLNEYHSTEPGLTVRSADSGFESPGAVFSKAAATRLIRLLTAMPHGVISMSQAVPGLVETSTNCAVLKTREDRVALLTSQRSSVNSSLVAVVESASAVGLLANATVEHHNGYPAWQPNPESATLQVAVQLWKKMFGVEPEVKAIHAGLECGIIGDKFPGMDMISFGPTIQGAHSPDERVQISTVEKFWNYLAGLIAKLAE